jgi:hypothetical protein
MMNLEQAKIYIESANWIFAKSYANTAPHEYNLLQDSDLDSFNAFCQFVNSNLVREPFYKTWFYYCYIGEYKYWTMEKVGEQPRLINRARIENKY